MTPEERALAPHTVYRAYGWNGALLYVGCSVDFKSRLSQHRMMQPDWLRWSVRITTEVFPDMESARDAEYRAINVDKPLCNLMGNGQWHEGQRREVVFEPHESAEVPA